MAKQTSFRDRLSLAINVLRGQPLRQRGSMQPWPTKSMPFIWPSFREGVPQWQCVDVQSYIDEGFSLNTLIYSAIMYKVRAMSVAPLRAYTGSVDKRDPLPPDDELSLLVARPNKHQSFTEFHGQNIVYLNVAGNCYIMMDRPKRDELPRAMYSLRPDRVVIVPVMQKGGVATVGYVYVPEGKTAWETWNAGQRVNALSRNHNNAFVIPPQDLMHVKFPNPADPLEGMGYGLSPIAPMARSADVDNKVTEFLKLFFDRGTMTYGLLKYDTPLDDPTISEIKAGWKEIYGGYKNWEDIAVFDRGVEYQRLGFTFDEMGFGEIDERNETRVLGPLGVPGILIGTRIGLTRATHSNATELRKMFWEDTMVPETTLFETEYKYYLATPDDAFVAFDYSKVPALQEVISQNADRVVTAYKDGAATRNEYRASIGLPQDEKRGSYYVMPIGMVEMPSGFTPKPPASPTQPATPAQQEDDEEGAASAVEDDEQRGEEDGKALEATQEVKAPPQSSLTQEAKAAHWKKVDAISTSWEPAFEDGAVAAFEADKRALLAILNAGKAAAYAGKRSTDWITVQAQAAEYLQGPAREQWADKFKPLISGVMEAQATNVEETFFSKAKSQRKQFAAEDWFNEYTLVFAQPICETTERDIALLLSQAQAQGWSIPTTMDRLETVFVQYMQGGLTADAFEWFEARMPQFRREMISRTEILRSSNYAANKTMSDFGAPAREWLATLDDRCRSSHLAANGQIVPMGLPFLVGGEEMMYPGDPSASPSNFINCRCAIAPAGI